MIQALLSLLSVWFLMSCTQRDKQAPIQVILVPAQESMVLEEYGQKLRLWLEKDIGRSVEVKVPMNYTAVIEAFGSKRADLAFMNSFGYLLAREKYQAEARLVTVSKGKKEYFGQIIARSDKVKTLKDLEGKNFAFVSPISGSGYLAALKFLKINNINIKGHSFMGKHDSVVTAIYQGRADAGATFYASDENGQPNDARRLVKIQYPDVFEKIHRLALTGPMPNEPVVLRHDLDESLKKKLIDSLKKYITTSEGKEVMHKMYHIEEFADTEDKAYDSLKEDMKLLGQDPKSLIE